MPHVSIHYEMYLPAGHHCQPRNAGVEIALSPPEEVDVTNSGNITPPYLARLPYTLPAGTGFIPIVMAFLLFLLSGCGTTTVPCGTFAFTGAPHSSRGIDAKIDFNFNPAACGASCTCQTICYVQIVRIIDQNTGNFLAPNSDQQNRIVTGQTTTALNGWAVDRLSARNWGYYGRNNDGSFASTLSTGSSTITATLRDTPSGWPDNSWFDAVSVPVCIDTSSGCVNRLLGYYYWLFIVNNGGNVGNPINQIAVTWHRDAFDLSVTEWNSDAPGLGKNSFPGMTHLEP